MDRSIVGVSIDDILTHHGVLGMRWGKSKSGGFGPVSRKPANVQALLVPGQKVRTSGGENRMPTEDAIKAAVYKQVARKSSTHALTTPELQTLVSRMNLESSYEKIMSTESVKTKGEGRKFVEKLLKNEANALALGKTGPLTRVVGDAMKSKYKGSHRK